MNLQYRLNVIRFHSLGGSEINPSEMYETFSDDPNAGTMVEFMPGGEMHSGICGKSDSALMWDSAHGGNGQSVTSQQLIVQQGYMLQFKAIKPLCFLLVHI